MIKFTGFYFFAIKTHYIVKRNYICGGAEMEIFRIIGIILLIPVLLVLLVALGVIGGIGVAVIYLKDIIGVAFAICLIAWIVCKIVKKFK